MLSAILLGALVLALGFYFNNKYSPTDPPVKQLVSIILIVITVLWVLRLLGV